MDSRKGIISRVVHGSQLPMDTVPALPLVELVGEHRVLIENHFGVSAYGCNEIHVRVKFGYICICGNCMELAQMTKERLVITGSFDSIQIIRKGK